MAYPADILLPANAKNYGFVDTKFDYNPHWDITWSFSFALTGTQHAFCTFLTSNPSLSTGLPGQYLGYLGNVRYLLSESGDIILDENGDRLVYDSPTNLSSYDVNGILSIAFDSTGFFAMSSTNNPGYSRSNLIRNSLIIRDSNNAVVYNQGLSSLDTQFFLTSATKNYQTLRFRYSNSGKKLYVDRKFGDSYKNLVDLHINFTADSYDVLYPGITFCSPISSLSITPSNLYLKNFHTQGNTTPPTYENVKCLPLSSSKLTIFKTISGIL